MPVTDDEHRDAVKQSGIGRVLMILAKHPDESLPNKKLAMRIIGSV